jgi:hypothetical protein
VVAGKVQGMFRVAQGRAHRSLRIFDKDQVQRRKPLADCPQGVKEFSRRLGRKGVQERAKVVDGQTRVAA